ncbi:MAG: hypothetical protein ACTSO2_19445 [Promethearchaeota archaeon]
MGRRKRKKQTYRRVRKLPKTFHCPECNQPIDITLDKVKMKYIVRCTRCNMVYEFDATNSMEPVDAYGLFIDEYYGQR